MTESNPQVSEPTSGTSTCQRCGAVFTCGMQAGEPVCWCAALPPLVTIPDDGAGCYCPACLKAMLEASKC